nr:hypothetical protein BaRGS_014934 [Batillaria attramentaria]
MLTTSGDLLVLADLTTAAMTTADDADLTTAAMTTAGDADLTTAAMTTAGDADLTTAAMTTAGDADLTTAAMTTAGDADLTTAAMTTADYADLTTAAMTTAACDDLLDTFMVYPDSGTDGANIQSIVGGTVEDCKAACVDRDDCLTFEYNPKYPSTPWFTTTTCNLQDLTPITARSGDWNPGTDIGWDTYQRRCA